MNNIRHLVACCLAVVMVTGCTTPPPRPSTTPPPSNERLKDRDERAVLAAFQRLDLCAAVDAARKATPALPADAKVATETPFGCRVSMPSTGDITVGTAGRGSSELPVRVLGGAKAYVDQRYGLCAVYLPVSFKLAIIFTQFGPPPEAADDRCKTTIAEALAGNVATILANPDSVAATPILDACSALKAALPPGTEKNKYIYNGDLGDCTDSFASMFLSMGLFVPPIPREATVDSLAGTQVSTYESKGICYIHWQQGPANARFAHESAYETYFSTNDCARSRAYAEAVINVLKQPPPDVAPQRPLLYAPDEPDGPDPKACKSVPASVAPPSGALQC